MEHQYLLVEFYGSSKKYVYKAPIGRKIAKNDLVVVLTPSEGYKLVKVYSTSHAYKGNVPEDHIKEIHATLSKVNR